MNSKLCKSLSEQKNLFCKDHNNSQTPCNIKVQCSASSQKWACMPESGETWSITKSKITKEIVPQKTEMMELAWLDVNTNVVLCSVI